MPLDVPTILLATFIVFFWLNALKAPALYLECGWAVSDQRGYFVGNFVPF